jgi:hypothetical protein
MGLTRDDRDPSGAMPPKLLYSGDKYFAAFFIGSARLFTTGCGELPGALLASAEPTVETVSVREAPPGQDMAITVSTATFPTAPLRWRSVAPFGKMADLTDKSKLV